MKVLTLFTFLCLLLSACDSGQKTDKPTGDTKAKATATADKSAAVAAKEPDAEMDNEDIPVAADFEEKAEAEITKDNLEDELAKLEKEVAAGDTQPASN
ncbi:MAG: hypothetical protein JRI68_13870 [Deltaproteobacteria bacterium]|nr:hypothetical protein [Deltaproteobacteria bacterium]